MSALLELEGVTSGYGRVEVLHGVDLEVPAGCVVAILGPNGMGKTTLLRTISGTLPVWRGKIRLHRRRLDRRSAYEVARLGVTLIPEGRGIFPGLAVRENLEIAARAGAAGRSRPRLDVALDTFPRLRERLDQRAGTLSGGEQQMLALSRALVVQPRVLLLDEISMGLAPIVVEELFDQVARLKAEGQTIVLVEQYLTYALKLADICYVLQKGRVAFVGEPTELATAGRMLGG